MASSTDTKMRTLAEIGTEIADEYPSIFTCASQRDLFKGDFELLVQTYVMEGSYVSIIR